MIDITKYLTNDLRKPKYRNKKNVLAGHCYVVAEALFHMYPGCFDVYYIKHENEPHWYLRDRWGKHNWCYVDPTVGQFKTIPNYEQGIRKGFLTKQPSKRARILMNRIKNKNVS